MYEPNSSCDSKGHGQFGGGDKLPGRGINFREASRPELDIESSREVRANLFLTSKIFPLAVDVVTDRLLEINLSETGTHPVDVPKVVRAVKIFPTGSRHRASCGTTRK